MCAAPELDARWQQLWLRAGATMLAAPLGARLLAAWSEPQRTYHTVEHLNDCLAKLDEFRGLARQPDEIELALWFHDAIYDPRAHDNERRSADWAMQELSDADLPALAARVSALVMLTRHEAESCADDGDAQLLIDIDLSILGAEAERFDRYEKEVRREYAFVPEPQFRQGRSRILQRFLQQSRLYLTAAFFERYEARARANLQRSLVALS